MAGRQRAVIAIALTQMLVMAAGAQGATTIHVPADQPTIQDAVNAASPGDTIAVAHGTYGERVTVDRSLTISGDSAQVGTADGAFIVVSPNVTITGFDVHGTTGIQVDTANVQLHYNRFAGTTTAIQAPPAVPVDATDNWFGCNAGANGGSGCQTTTGDVSATPFLKLAIASSSEAIETGKQVTITASLRADSAGTDLGTIPFPALPVTFATSLGTIDALGPLGGGAAVATLKVGDAPGTAHVTAALDNATVATDVRVLSPGGTTPPPDGGGTTPPPGGGTTIKLVLNQLTGTNAADKIFGTEAAELILGLAGDDELHGGKGDDRIFAGDGQDRAYGDDGDDRVNGGPGDDRIEGRNGNDLLEGSAGRDKLVGGRGNDVLVGGSGADTIIAHLGDDTVRGGTGDDTIDVRDHENGDIVACGAGKDTVKADSKDVVAKDCEKVTRPKAKSKKSNSKK